MAERKDLIDLSSWCLPQFSESILTNPKFAAEKTEFMSSVDRFANSLWGGRYAKLTFKEGLTKDAAGALGRMSDLVVEAARPALIGREMIDVMPTQEALIRFSKAKLGKAKLTQELAEIWLHGEKYETQDIKPSTLIKCGMTWSKEFVEDATWPVMERQASECGRALAELEFEKILALYDGISAGDLAGGSAYNGSGTLNWAGVVGFWNRVKKENFAPNVLVISQEQAADLWQDDKFIHGFYWGSDADIRRGVMGATYLGMKILVSTKVTDGTVYAIDKSCAVMPIRRDILSESFEDSRLNEYGIVSTERVGLGVLRTKGVSRGTGW